MQDCTQYSAVFKWVQHTPVGLLKSLSCEKLLEVREILVTEVREVGRAMHWVDGVLRLKGQEEQPRDGSPPDGSPWGGSPRDESPWGGTN